MAIEETAEPRSPESPSLAGSSAPLRGGVRRAAESLPAQQRSRCGAFLWASADGPFNGRPYLLDRPAVTRYERATSARLPSLAKERGRRITPAASPVLAPRAGLYC